MKSRFMSFFGRGGLDEAAPEAPATPPIRTRASRNAVTTAAQRPGPAEGNSPLFSSRPKRTAKDPPAFNFEDQQSSRWDELDL
jgi:hypothetical protein